MIYSAAIGLMLLGVASVSGQEGEEATRRGLVGEVTGVSHTEDGDIAAISVTTAEGEEVTILVPEGLEPVTPGKPAVTGVAGTMGLGAIVAVLAEENSDGDLVALQVMVKPGDPTPPVNGVVVGMDSERRTITVLTPDGSEHLLQLPEEAQLPDLGDMVTAFRGIASSSGDEDEGESEAPSQATGLVKADEVRARLQRHAEELAAEGADLAGLGEDERAARLEEVRQLLDGHGARHVEALDRVLLLVPEQARQSIEMAKAKAELGRQKAIEAVERAMGRAGGPPSGLRDGAGGPPSNRPGKPDTGAPPDSSEAPEGTPDDGYSGDDDASETPEETSPPADTSGDQSSAPSQGSQGGQGQQGGSGGRP